MTAPIMYDSETYRVASLYGDGGIVKQAEDENTDGLPNHLFADRVHRLYPVHTAAATWQSASRYFDKHANDDRSDVAKNIASAARVHGITPKIEALRKKAAELNNTSLDNLPDDMFAVVWKSASGVKERRMPLRNAGEIEKAAEYLAKYRDEFAFKDRNTIAKKILSRSSEFDVFWPVEKRAFLEIQAGLGRCTSKALKDALLKRADFLQGRSPAGIASKLRELAGHVESNPVHLRSAEARVKMASFLIDLDRRTGLSREYGQGLNRPDDEIFQINLATLEKTASDHFSMVNDVVYKKTDLAAVPLEKVAGEFGADFVEQIVDDNGSVDVEKFASVAATLPLPDARVLKGLLTQAGVSPAYVEKQASGLDVAAWRAFAGIA